MSGEADPGCQLLKGQDLAGLAWPYLEQVAHQVRQARLNERKRQGLIVVLLREQFAARPADLALARLGREPGKLPDVKYELL